MRVTVWLISTGWQKNEPRSARGRIASFRAAFSRQTIMKSAPTSYSTARFPPGYVLRYTYREQAGDGLGLCGL